MSDTKNASIQTETLHTDNICAIRDDEVIKVCADLVPDDIDMYPRTIGSSDMPFREVIADSLTGNLNPQDERGVIGGRMPFDIVCAKTIYGNLRGTIHDMAFPGNLSGYGWILLTAENTADGVMAAVQRAIWPGKFYTLTKESGRNPRLAIRLMPPFIPFVHGNPVFVESVYNEIDGCDSMTKTKSVTPRANKGIPEVELEIDLPQNVSCRYQILIRIY